MRNVLVCVGILLMVAACSSVSPSDSCTNEGCIPDVEQSSNMQSPDLKIQGAAAAVRSQVAQELGVIETSVLILSVQGQTWSDGCLGLGGPAESCMFSEVPGFEVVIQVQGEQRTYRTDYDGTIIRLETLSESGDFSLVTTMPVPGEEVEGEMLVLE